MSVRSKIRYLNALLSLLPFGIIAIAYSLYGLFNYTSIESLKKITGEPSYFGNKTIYSKVAKTMDDAFVITFKVDGDSVECNTFVNTDKEKLQILFSSKINYLQVWYDPKIGNLIKQVELNGKIVLPYDPPYIAYIILIAVGLVFTIIPLLYLIQNPEEYNS